MIDMPEMAAPISEISNQFLKQMIQLKNIRFFFLAGKSNEICNQILKFIIKLRDFFAN
jgi:hypothetical protein